MKKRKQNVSIEDIRRITLNILKCITSFCDSNNINYILSDGTLLGAVRHNGFIPWDDDIDISMSRKDYERFISLWKDTYEYSLLCYEKYSNFYLPFAKIVDKSMIAYENGKKTFMGGLWVDIFPLDNIPDSEEERIIHWNNVIQKYDTYFTIYSSKSRSNSELSFLLRKIKWSIKKRNIKILTSELNDVFQKLNKEIQKYNDTDCLNITNNVVIIRRPEKRKLGYPRTVLTDYEYASFENESFRIPKDYDSLLSSYYNNYMELPPEKDRVFAHNIKLERVL